MALRDQPYFPLYVQDYLTDEKLNLCSLATQGVYIKIMCLMHKSEAYGKILLKQKFSKGQSACQNFALQISKQLPIPSQDIEAAISELLEEGVLKLDGGALTQKRMVKDNEVSLARSEAGKKGVGAKGFAKAKPSANSEYENENENEGKGKGNKKGKGKTAPQHKQIEYPFTSSRFIKYWEYWKVYKAKEFKFRYKSAQSEQAALMNLDRLSGHNEDVCLKIITQSIANGWKGFFELKQNYENTKTNNKGATPDEVAAIIAKHFAEDRGE